MFQLPAGRAIDWTKSGVPGGIPSAAWPIFTIIQASTYGNGSSDATTGIQNALNSCPSNQVVLLSAGTFLINGALGVPSNVVLRGAGPAQLGSYAAPAQSSYTTLNAMGSSSDAVVQFGLPNGSNPTNTLITINAGFTQGSTSISVASTSGMAVGMLAIISELNEPFVTNNGTEGLATWTDGGLWNGTRSLGQIVTITSISGSNVGITPLYYSYNASYIPSITPFPVNCTNAGVENLTIYANNTGYTRSIFFFGATYSWCQNVECNFADGNWLDLYWSYRCEVRHCNFHDAYVHGPGGTDSCVDIANKSSGCLVVDNICWRGHIGIMLEWGAAGNVIAYNFIAGNFDSGSPGATFGGINQHGAHPMFNLIEGNIIENRINFDSVWGSSSNQVLLRNWATGTSYVSNPQTGRGTGPFNDALSGTPFWSYQANYACEFCTYNTSATLIGNCMGSQQLIQGVTFYLNGTTLACNDLIVAPTTRSYDHNTYCYTYGYSELSDDGSASTDTTTPYTTVIIAGDFNYATTIGTPGGTPSGAGEIIWLNATQDTIPNSLFLSGPPAWFGNLAWPPISPQNPPTTPNIVPLVPVLANTSSALIPAGYRFINGADPIPPGSLEETAAGSASITSNLIPRSVVRPLVVTRF